MKIHKIRHLSHFWSKNRLFGPKFRWHPAWSKSLLFLPMFKHGSIALTKNAVQTFSRGLFRCWLAYYIDYTFFFSHLIALPCRVAVLKGCAFFWWQQVCIMIGKNVQWFINLYMIVCVSCMQKRADPRFLLVLLMGFSHWHKIAVLPRI